MIRNFLISICMLFFIISNSAANTFLKEASISPTLVQEGQSKHWCPISGLDLKSYYKTSYTAKLQMNGALRQYSSMHCLAVDMKEYGIDKKSIQVVDVISEKYIQASSAVYLIKSKIAGTMSKESKLAFSSLEEAKKFQEQYAGEIVSFEEALQMAQASLDADALFMKHTKNKKIYPRGKKIFDKVCQAEAIDPTDYLEINELKSALVENKWCKPLKEKDLHAVSLYIWEVKRFGDLDSIQNKVHVREDEKCPVCGMFTYKYPKWAAQIFYEENGEKKHWSFDGVKDLMKFYFDAQRWGNYPIAKQENITKILVTDYYTQKAIDGVKAFYVIRSDIYGPMGHEFIPFENKGDAETFKKDHYGKEIVEFKDIVEAEVYALDENE